MAAVHSSGVMSPNFDSSKTCVQGKERNSPQCRKKQKSNNGGTLAHSASLAGSNKTTASMNSNSFRMVWLQPSAKLFNYRRPMTLSKSYQQNKKKFEPVANNYCRRPSRRRSRLEWQR